MSSEILYNLFVGYLENKGMNVEFDEHDLSREFLIYKSILQFIKISSERYDENYLVSYKLLSESNYDPNYCVLIQKNGGQSNYKCCYFNGYIVDNNYSLNELEKSTLIEKYGLHVN